MQKTDIEYLTHTWNPIAMKCHRIAAGCVNCWHLNWCHRFGESQKDPKLRAAYTGGDFVLREEEISAPSRIKKPSRIGVQFMGDLFHENVTDEMLQNVLFNIHYYIYHQKHTFLILTKRPSRMKDYLKKTSVNDKGGPKNLWLGVSISTNADLWMVDRLLEIQAAVRFVSVEPQLEYINITKYIERGSTRLINWVVCGAETGNGKRPFDAQWGRMLMKQSHSEGVPFFFKQDGSGNNTIDGETYQEFPE